MKAAQYIKNKGFKRVLSDLEIVEKHGFNSFFTPKFVQELKTLIAMTGHDKEAV